MPIRATAYVSLDNIENNIRVIQSKLNNKETKVMATVKGDAYGHGARAVSQRLYNIGIRYFGVSSIEEAVELRSCIPDDAQILIFGYTHPSRSKTLCEKNIIQTIYSLDIAKAFSENLGDEKLRVHIAIDSGMGRIGFQNADEIVSAAKMHGLKIEGAFTHFSCADETSDKAKNFTRNQFEKFMSIINEIENKGIELKLKHACNSAAIFKYPEYQLDMVRAGIVIYGLAPNPDDIEVYKEIIPAMQLKAPISHIKMVEKGTSIGYGADFCAQEPMRVATVPIGYADGYSRAFCKGYTLVRGKRAKILGRVCMDQLMIDVTDIPEAALFDTVTLFGESEGKTLSCDDLARLSNTINYEIVCDISKRVVREY